MLRVVANLKNTAHNLLTLWQESICGAAYLLHVVEVLHAGGLAQIDAVGNVLTQHEGADQMICVTRLPCTHAIAECNIPNNMLQCCEVHWFVHQGSDSISQLCMHVDQTRKERTCAKKARGSYICLIFCFSVCI